ncbi:D-2-hydroxyacid dehydrogenase [Halobaculum sp. CBA1158]|uniref:D-2-hydroxyacid dehydrogenase n=1 Tax=Halobaculum sp. CBA1158 TaxID=2904243 RepID=UPI001F30CC15|nr:D-2-hydroxyacid dehydrogenase [Halobaculum sp. CBA1158]UIO99363.1 D-2-hydroxyacid dehydrogenase [Halobaculum sp. CBA1158]
MSADPTLLLAHTVGPDRGRDLRERLLAEGLPADRVVAAETPAETDAHAADARGVVIGRLPDGLLERADSLRWVQTLSSGTDYLPTAELADGGVTVTNSAGVHAEPIGEQVLGYMLSFERDLHALARQQAESRWERREGGELRGKTVGIVGVGAIGTRVAELASAFGTDVWGVKRDLDSMPDAVDEPRSPEDLHEVCLAADYLVLACPLTDETAGLIGGDELRLLGGDGVLVNVARGEVCDQDALVGALRSHLIRGAALDVFEEEPLPSDSPLWELSNAVVTPHMAGSTPHKAERWTEIIAENYRRLARDGEERLRNRVT